LESIGEIVKVEFTTITCEAKNIDNLPTPGTFVRFYIKDYMVIGCVTRYEIGSIESQGYPSALWSNINEIKNNYPEIDQILKGYFDCLVIGSIYNGRFINGLPNRSIPIHAQVEKAETDDILLATQNALFINTILKATDVDVIVVMPSIVYYAYIVRNKDNNYLYEIGKQLSIYLNYDLNTLVPLIERIESLAFNL